MGVFRDLVGMSFGRLRVLAREGSNKHKKATFKCKCSCGNIVVVSGNSLMMGCTSSCGCLKKQVTRDMAKTHGMSKTKEYKAWTHINQRCYNQNCEFYYCYGGAGITSEFKDSFEDFYAEIGPCPKAGKWSVDRIDPTKNYERGNIKWSTDAQQAKNKKKLERNTSGRTGVYWDNKIINGVEYLSACATWRQLDGKSRKKQFSVNKYGLLESFAMACLCREKMIAELNEQGAGYSINHGK